MRQQDLAVVGQAEPAGRAMEQTDLEMLLQLRDQTGDRRLADMGFPGDGGERAGLGHPDESAQRSDQVHYFLDLRKDEFQESRIIFPGQEVYLMPIARRDNTTDLPPERSVATNAPAKTAGADQGERP